MAYTTATFTRIDKNSDGRLLLVLTYTGSAGEDPVEFAYPVEASSPPSANYMRELAMKRIAVLNMTANFYAAALPFVGTVLDTTTPLPATPPETFGAYMASTAPFGPGSTPQDVFTITGSATRTIQIQRIGITTVQTSAGMNAWSLVKRSAANTSGTSAFVSAVPVSDLYGAATATVRQYTAAPTLGTLVGAVWTGRVASPAPGSAPGNNIEKIVDMRDSGVPITLTGSGDVLAWNFGGVVLPAGLSIQASVWWTEF